MEQELLQQVQDVIDTRDKLHEQLCQLYPTVYIVNKKWEACSATFRTEEGARKWIEHVQNGDWSTEIRTMNGEDLTLDEFVEVLQEKFS